MTWDQTEIPRHKSWGGPLVIAPGRKRGAGDKSCPRCGRPCKTGKCAETRRGTAPQPGDCHCLYYRRTTNFVDVLQSEYALKKYDRRMVAYGMSQRPDLVLSVAALRDIDGADKDALQGFADDAKDAAKAAAGANIGTALHRLTEDMDHGRTLGRIPDPYPADLKAYAEATKGIEWVGIECFRVCDEFKVAGTADRIGCHPITKRLHIFDLKTSPKENPINYPHGPAMQLGMYAHSTPYDIPTDTRIKDVGRVDLNTGYIISLPAGKGRCEIRPINIGAGWAACLIAVQVWRWREDKKLILDDEQVPIGPTYSDLAAKATTEDELRALWARAKRMCALTDDVKADIMSRREQLQSQAAS